MAAHDYASGPTFPHNLRGLTSLQGAAGSASDDCPNA
jgi:hypothetical protein